MWICLNATARWRSFGPLAALRLIVQLSSERTLEPVRRDSCFAEKQESDPALVLAVRSARPAPEFGGARFGTRDPDTDKEERVPRAGRTGSGRRVTLVPPVGSRFVCARTGAG